MGVFVFVVKEAFDLPCLLQDYKDKIEISEFVKFCNKSFTEFFVSAAKRELDEHSNPAHTFTWCVLSSAQTFHKRRIVEGLMIQQLRPSLNKQVISYVSKLFPAGIT